MAIFLKDPAATIDYAIDWAGGYLLGQSIMASTWAVVPGGAAALRIEAGVIEAGRTIATLAGGQAGDVYRVTNRVTFSDGRSDERTLAVRVEDR